jgi:hypothetical protein
MTRRVFECKLTDFFRPAPPIFWKSWDRAEINQRAKNACRCTNKTATPATHGNTGMHTVPGNT